MSAPLPRPLSEAERERLRAIRDRLIAGDAAAAAVMASDALAAGIEHPFVLDLAAGHHEANGRVLDALALLERARTLAPDAPGSRNALGLVLQRLDRHEAAVAEFSAAIAAAPGFAPAFANRADSLVHLSRLRDARADYEHALSLDPALLNAKVGLAALAVRRGAPEEAIALARAVLDAQPGFPPALLTLAEAELAAGRPERVGASLRQVLDEPRATATHRAIAESLLGDTLDALGRADDAFQAYEAAGESFRRFHAPAYGGAPPPQLLLDASAATLVRLPSGAMAPAQPPPASPRHVFLVGFPRSGTTLLEQMLEQHPEVRTLAERDFMPEASAAAWESPQAFMAMLRRPDAALDVYRRSYWDRVRAEGIDPERTVVVDKHPFHSFRLPLVARLFPDATILLALRDPRDVVLSCFRRRFAMNSFNYQLLTPAGAAGLYDAAMRLVAATRHALAPRVVSVRLEDLVTGFEAETRRLCGALGLDWTPELGRFAERVGDRGIATPSAPQLARGLNAEGVGQWRAYARALAPVLPKLAPWVAAYGYSQ